MSNIALTGVAIVFGAAGGLGKETAFQLAEAGCRAVVFADINDTTATAAESAKYASNPDYKSHSVLVDIASHQSVQQVLDETVSKFGRIDYVANTAAIGDTNIATRELDPEHMNRMIDINLKGSIYVTTLAARIMSTQTPLEGSTSGSSRHKKRSLGRGVIVNIGSSDSFQPQETMLPYVSSKHGLVGATKNAALDWGRDGVRVNCVCPGPIDTPMSRKILDHVEGLRAVVEQRVPLDGGRFAEPEEIASTIVYLCGPGATYVTGGIWLADGGFTLGKGWGVPKM